MVYQANIKKTYHVTRDHECAQNVVTYECGQFNRVTMQQSIQKLCLLHRQERGIRYRPTIRAHDVQYNMVVSGKRSSTG